MINKGECMWKLFLDDIRKNDPNTILAKSVNEAIDLINTKGFPSFISFDNDLGLGNKEGVDFVNIIIDKVLDGDWIIPSNFSFQVHSDNIPANENIRVKMNSFLKHLGIKFCLEKSIPYSQRN